MKLIVSLAALAIAMPTVAHSMELKPLQGGSFELGDHAVSIYYTENDQDYQVVTTIAPVDDIDGAPIRFVGLMAPGQTETVSVGSFNSTVSEVLELVHNGDHLTVLQKIQTASID